MFISGCQADVTENGTVDKPKSSVRHQTELTEMRRPMINCRQHLSCATLPNELKEENVSTFM